MGGELQKRGRRVFFGGGFALMAVVFCVTLVFSLFLPPLYLSIPLLAAYYGVIWSTVYWYGKKAGPGGGVLKREEFRPTFAGLSTWMLAWVIAYPLVVGVPVFIWIAPRLPGLFIALGVLFSLINGPSEEIFWRLMMERAGRDAGISPKTRLWYSSAVFASWHFIFIIFLLPRIAWPAALATTLSSTFIAGLLWMKIYQKTANMFALAFSHALVNLFIIWPATASTVLGVSPFPMG